MQVIKQNQSIDRRAIPSGRFRIGIALYVSGKLQRSGKEVSWLTVILFTQRLGNTRFCINVHFAEDESAGTYEEKLLNVIRHEADNVQQKDEHGHDENDPAA